MLAAVAFHEPVANWLVPDPARRRLVMTGLFTLMAADALASGGWVDILTGPDSQLAGAAIWLNRTLPEAAPTEEPDPHLDETFGPDADRWHTLDDLMTRHHLTGPHHYLAAVGVLPDHQNAGLGGHLLGHGHQRLGRLPAHLKATSPDSRRLCHRHGYHDLGRIDLPEGPSPWRLWHTPAETQD